MKGQTTIARLFPELTEDELEAAEENFNGYLETVIGIYERITAEEGAQPSRPVESLCLSRAVPHPAVHHTMQAPGAYQL